MKTTTRKRIKAGHGYWDTSQYPIGGNFRCAPDGQSVWLADHKRDIKPMYHGCDVEYYLPSGNTVALNSRYIELVDVHSADYE